MTFLDEASARSAIRSALLDTTEAKIAVAFWGSGAVEALGLSRPDLNVQVICNLESGACNPAVLRQLTPLAAGGLRSDPRLHAKVYWTSSKVILGSSNASSNGLAVEGNELGSWAEANVLLTDPQLIAEISDWFDCRLDAAHLVEEEDITWAEQIWKSRKKMRPSGARLTDNLLEAYRAAPGRRDWGRVKFAFWTEDVDDVGTKDANEQIQANGALGEYGYYQDWKHLFEAGDWIVDFDLSGKAPCLEGYYHVPNPKIEGRCVTFVRSVRGISIPGFPRLQLSSNDVRAIIGVRHALLQKHGDDLGNGVIQLSDVVAGLVQPASKAADTSSFEREMRRIYDEACAIGYTPTRYLEMLSKLGGLDTARQLLRPGPPSEGFVNLVMRNRQDLAVEALALDQRWRSLFSEDELKVARSRLGLSRNANG